MNYVFVFLGEFGVELLNWQGVIRKFSRTLSPADQIICCSRANLYPLYETAVAYLDLDQVELFQRSRACGYGCYPTRVGRNLIKTWRFERRLRADIKSFVLTRLRERALIRDNEPCQFIFSSSKQRLNGCTIGRSLTGWDRVKEAWLGPVYGRLKSALPSYEAQLSRLKSLLYKTIPPLDHIRTDGNIYDRLELNNNIYQKIEPDMSVLNTVEEKLGWALDEPFVLCQNRMRDVEPLSKDILPNANLEQLIEALAQQVKVVLLSFQTNRWLDSYSAFENLKNGFRYTCNSFAEQACLVHFANHCLFFTEGDLGSNTYVPPFLGRDVTVVAPRSVYQLDSSPIDFWNRKVFQFGGQMIPKVSEEIFSCQEQVQTIVNDILNRVD